jgi:hypothetical protein
LRFPHLTVTYLTLPTAHRCSASGLRSRDSSTRWTRSSSNIGAVGAHCVDPRSRIFYYGRWSGSILAEAIERLRSHQPEALRVTWGSPELALFEMARVRPIDRSNFFSTPQTLSLNCHLTQIISSATGCNFDASTWLAAAGDSHAGRRNLQTRDGDLYGHHEKERGKADYYPCPTSGGERRSSRAHCGAAGKKPSWPRWQANPVDIQVPFCNGGLQRKRIACVLKMRITI